MIENDIYEILENFEGVLMSYTNGEEIDFEYVAILFTQINTMKRMVDMLPVKGEAGDMTEILTKGYGTRIEIDVVKALNNAVMAAKSGTVDDYHVAVLEEQIVRHHSKRIEV